MGAKAIPHLLARLDASEPLQPQLMMVPFDGLPDPVVIASEPMFDLVPAPRETQGPAKLLVSDQMENLLGWYI
jgi:hypothetical protein